MSLGFGPIASEPISSVPSVSSGPTYTLTLDGGSFAFTGGDLALKVGRKLVLDGGAFALSGGDVSLKAGRKLALDGGTFAFSGGDVAFTYTPSGTTYTLALDGGEFAFTGGDLDFIYTSRGTQQGGGWLPYVPTREEREEFVRKQREALGIIPKRIQPVAKVIKRIAKQAAKRGIEPTIEQVQLAAPIGPIEVKPVADALAISYQLYLSILLRDRLEREKTRQFIEQQIEQAKANALEAARLQEEEEVFVVMSILLAD